MPKGLNRLRLGMGSYRRGSSTPPTPATITINSIGPQQSDGDVPASVTSSADVTAENVLFDAAEANPGAADFGGAGAPTYIDLNTVALTSGVSTPEVALPSGLQGNFKWGVRPPGGGDAHVAVSASFALDTTGSVLSPVSFTDDSAEGVDWAFTPDEDSAAVTGYRVSIWPDGTDPSDAEIASGTGATATVTGTAAASVAESGNFAALGAGTYQPTIWYKDAFGNEVFETYTDVTVAAVSSGPTVSAYSGFTLVEDVDIGGTLYDIYTSNTASPSITFSAGGDVDYLLVGGGGGGGGVDGGRAAGGGGGGEVKSGTTTVTATTYNPTQGAGGAIGTGSTNGSSGGATSFNGISAAGGGGGGGRYYEGTASVNSGGSGNFVSTFAASTGGGYAGGGGSGTDTTTGPAGGGGGGMGEAGSNGVQSVNGGDGGDGLANSITGSSVTYGGGGGGGIRGGTGGAGGAGGGGAGGSSVSGVAGTDGLGGGGGGGALSGVSAVGGNGVIIIRVEAA